MNEKKQLKTEVNEKIKLAFHNLARNGFDFFQKSIVEFDTEPKYAVIHFCIGLESILKARLMKEHWSLIVEEINNKTTVDNFIDGKLKSITIEETISRLRSISGCDISDSAKDSFTSIINERNKIIHFYNKEFFSEKIQENLVKKQYMAWYYIDSLLKEWWRFFSDFKNDREHLKSSMMKYKTFLQVKYDTIKRELLDKLSKENYFINKCGVCGHRSLVYYNNKDNLHYGICKVCDNKTNGVQILCKSCNQIFVYDAYNKRCKRKHLFKSDEIIEYLKEKFGYISTRHEEGYDYWLANCTSCDGVNSVIKLPDDQWFCIECGDNFDKASICEWCNEQYAGEKEDTYAFGCGCSFCEGSIGWHADDED